MQHLRYVGDLSMLCEQNLGKRVRSGGICFDLDGNEGE